MSNSKKEIDIDEIETYLLQKGPNLENVSRGKSKRRERNLQVESQKKAISIRLDQDIYDEFNELAGGRGYQKLINKALREWLVARGVTEIVEEKMEELSEKLLKQAQSNSKTPRRHPPHSNYADKAQRALHEDPAHLGSSSSHAKREGVPA